MFKYRILFLLFVSTNLSCINYGSWNQTDQYTSALVISGATNTIRRMALFDGLTFQNAATSAAYSALLPISGSVNLNGGTLTLERELQFGDLVSFVGPGKIYGTTTVHDVSFPGTLRSWGYTYTFQDVFLRFENDLNLNSQFTFQNTCTVDGDKNLMDLRGGGTIFIASGATVTFSNLSIIGLKDSNLVCMDTTSKVFFDGSTLLLSGTYTFAQGSIDIVHENAISGTGLFAYTSAQNLNINTKSSLLLDKGVTFSYDSSAASKDKLVFEDVSSTLILRGCTLHSTHTGLKLDGGILEVEDRVIFENEASVAAEAMEFGSNLTVNVRAGATLDLTRGLINYQ
jgi:hypothetical protein